MRYSVASVPFLNAKPLVWSLEQLGEESPVSMSYDWPSRLPSLLESGTVQAVLVSSIDALTHPERRIAGGCSISSRGRVKSVKIFSKVPLDRIETLALDASSMTSNALAQIVLKRMFSCSPITSVLDPDGTSMLVNSDACVLIGDKGLMFEGSGLFQLDLGEAWVNLTALPFVWAAWIGEDGLSNELASHLLEARLEGEANIASVAGEAGEDIPTEIAHDYLTTVFDYGLATDQLRGLRQFGAWILEDGLAGAVFEPEIVEPSFATV